MYEVSVIIPNYNGKQYLKDCLDAMQNQDFEDFEVILVDNGSDDGSVEYVKTHYPEVRLLTLKKNTGFCKAVNVGIKASTANYVLLLNNDTRAEREFVKALVRCIKAKPKAFSCQAKMLQLQDPRRMDDAGNYYCAFGWAYADGKGKPEGDYKKEKKIFSACGAAVIYRRKLLEQVGLFDEVHFAYLEDLDIGYRAKIMGFENWFCPKARVQHVGSGTSGSRYNLFKVRYSSRNNIYLIYKNMPFLQILWNLPLLCLGFGCKALFFAQKGFGRDYMAGLRKGFTVCRQNKKKKVHGYGAGSYIKIQVELYVNLFRFLRK